MRHLAVLTFVTALLGISSDAFAQAKAKGITYQKVTVSICRRMCEQRGWSASDCVSYCRPGSCKRAKTGGEHFCVIGKK